MSNVDYFYEVLFIQDQKLFTLQPCNRSNIVSFCIKTHWNSGKSDVLQNAYACIYPRDAMTFQAQTYNKKSSADQDNDI